MFFVLDKLKKINHPKILLGWCKKQEPWWFDSVKNGSSAGCGITNQISLYNDKICTENMFIG